MSRVLPKLGHRAPPMLLVHRPFGDARGKLYGIELRRDGLRLGEQRTHLDGGG